MTPSTANARAWHRDMCGKVAQQTESFRPNFVRVVCLLAICIQAAAVVPRNALAIVWVYEVAGRHEVIGELVSVKVMLYTGGRPSIPPRTAAATACAAMGVLFVCAYTHLEEQMDAKDVTMLSSYA